MAVRPIDGNELLGIERLLDTDIVRQSKVASWLLDQVLHDIQAMPTLTPPNEPLTLERLREMDGEPVWVHVVDHTVFADKKDDFDGYGLVRKSWVRVWDEKRADLIHVDYDFCDCGKEWLAYADEPPRLDRSAWEPCILCVVGDCKHLEYSFCPHCGRPLTDSAWEMLEKRLEAISE